ncbi:MAG: glycosyltransferase [Candidatus Levybacteria bacterium]|nr:glycosyltransferase [Candidatus Levybacteria bacterium]
MKQPLVSIIIPCFNSEKFIKDCLDSLKKQTYKNVEIFVIDNPRSTDKAGEIAKKYTKNVFVIGPERSAQINFGVKKAKGRYMYRVDSDFVVEPNVIAECVDKCEKEKLDGIAVHNTSAEGLGFWADVRKFERNSYIDDDLIVGVRFFTKKSWEDIGGFDEKLYGPEDYDFHNRFVKKGFKWGRVKSIERHLGEPHSISDIWKKHYFYGEQMVSYFKKHPRIALEQFNPVRISYFKHLGSIIAHPAILMGLITMTVVKFTAGGLGFIKGSMRYFFGLNK